MYKEMLISKLTAVGAFILLGIYHVSAAVMTEGFPGPLVDGDPRHSSIDDQGPDPPDTTPHPPRDTTKDTTDSENDDSLVKPTESDQNTPRIVDGGSSRPNLARRPPLTKTTTPSTKKDTPKKQKNKETGDTSGNGDDSLRLVSPNADNDETNEGIRKNIRGNGILNLAWNRKPQITGESTSPSTNKRVPMEKTSEEQGGEQDIGDNAPPRTLPLNVKDDNNDNTQDSTSENDIPNRGWGIRRPEAGESMSNPTINKGSMVDKELENNHDGDSAVGARGSNEMDEENDNNGDATRIRFPLTDLFEDDNDTRDDTQNDRTTPMNDETSMNFIEIPIPNMRGDAHNIRGGDLANRRPTLPGNVQEVSGNTRGDLQFPPLGDVVNRRPTLPENIQDGPINTRGDSQFPNLGNINIRGSFDDTNKRSINSLNNMFSNMANVVRGVRNALGDMNERYPPLQKIFKTTSDFFKQLSERKKNLITTLQDSMVQGSPAFNLSRLSENDALRLLDELEDIPDDIKNKMSQEGGLETLSSSEIDRIPVSVLPTLTEEKVTEFNALPEEKLRILCNKLMATGASPWNFRSAIEAGLNCAVSPTHLEPMEMHKNPKEKGLGCSLSRVMMAYVRETQGPESWDSTTFIAMAKALTDAITAEDIARVPENVLRNSIKNISTVEFPFKSQVRAVIDRASSVYNTPTSWPETFITDTGSLLEQMDINKVALLRNDAVYNLAEELEGGIEKDLTRLVLAKSIHTAFKKKQHSDDVANVMSWLKGEMEFINSLTPQSIVDTFNSHDLSTIPFSTAEKHVLAEKVEGMLMSDHFGNDTEGFLVDLSSIIEGFTSDFIDWVPDYLTPNITQNVPFKQISKARRMIKKLKRHHRKERLSAREAVTVFSGLELSDIDTMSADELNDTLPLLRSMDLPFHIGNKVVRKLERLILRENMTGCNMAFMRFGNLAVHINPQVIEDENYVPVDLEENDVVECPQNGLVLTTSQAIAVMDNVNTMLMTKSKGTAPLNAKILRRLGRFVEGMSVKVIESLPLDTELLSMIEVMSDHEDDLSSAQAEALVEKIRQYFDLASRQKITEASDVMIAQIRRLLQYLNTDFELPKFPKELRPSISREIGKSSLLKVSTGRRQALLTFALKNADAGNRTTKDLMLQQSIDNHDIQDLGSLKCGLTPTIISKLTQAAIDLNMDEFKLCPFRDEIFEALMKKAVDLDINRLAIRHKLGNLGAGLQYIDEKDITFLNKKEVSTMASYLTSSTRKLESVFEKSEKNGFVLEQTAHRKGLQKQRRKRFAGTIYSAMKDTHNNLDCSKLLFMGSSLPNVEDTANVDYTKCLDEVGMLSTWEKTDARRVLKQILNSKGKSMNMETLSSMDPDMIVETSGLLKGLTDTEMIHLNLTDINTLAAVGAHDFTHAQLQNGFETWNSNQPARDNDQLSEDDLASMQNFACGMPTSYIQNRVAGRTVRNCLGGLGRRRCFRPDQMNTLATKVTEAMGSTPVSEWKSHLVHEMGHLIGGLDRSSLQQLSKEQMSVIEPEVISAMQPEKVTELTVQQLEDLSPNQAAAFTTMQRSFMTEDQMAAIGRDFINGSGQNTVANCSILVIVLSLIRQLVIHL